MSAINMSNTSPANGANGANKDDDTNCRICYGSIAEADRGQVFPCGHNQFHGDGFHNWQKACVGICRCPCCNETVDTFCPSPGAEIIDGRSTNPIAIPVPYFDKVEWVTQLAHEGKLECWFVLYLELTCACLMHWVWKLQEPSTVEMTWSDYLARHMTCTLLAPLLVIHLSVAPVYYDWKHQTLSGRHFAAFLLYPWLLLASVSCDGGNEWVLGIILVSVFAGLLFVHERLEH
jgi:hypothetical protein